MDVYRLKSLTEFTIIYQRVFKTLSILYNTPLLQFQFNWKSKEKKVKNSLKFREI